MSDKKQTLHRKLFLARKAAESVPKKGWNKSGKFRFRRSEDVLAEALRQLEKRDIFYISRMAEESLRFGTSGFAIATTAIEYEVIDTKTGESLTVRWVGTGHDSPGDKAIYKATTGTTKDFLTKLLALSDDSDPEAEGDDPDEAEPGTSPAAEKARREQDAAAEEPDLPPRVAPRHKPLPETDLPGDWTGLEQEGEPVHA